MTKSISVFLVIIVCQIYPTNVFSQSNDGKLAYCKLFIDGVRYISGKCFFSTIIDRSGSFQIMPGNGKYFAQVHVTSPGIANGYWNEDVYANHAHSSLGELMREGACWTNERVSVCAW